MPDISTFELTIQSTTTDGEYRLVAEWSQPGGLPMRRERTLLLDPAQLPDQSNPTRYGEALGQLVFAEGVRELFAQARGHGSELRVLLAVEAKTLQALRWERLAGPIDETWPLLGQSQRTPLSIYLPSACDRRFSPFGRRDLRALVVVANPLPDNRYRVDPFDEKAAIDTALEGLGEIPSTVLGKDPRAEGPPTVTEICKRLTAQHYTLLHVVCHGAFSARSGETALFLDGDDGSTDAVKTTDFIQRLRELGTARGLPHFSFLGVCDSAKPEAETAMGGLGQRLVRELGMPAVVAMTEKVRQATAFALGRALYGRLRDHGMVDLALAEACVEVRRNDDVVVPALFSRLAGRPLFSDDLDRPLTSSEITAAAEQLEVLFQERAPELVERARTLGAAVSVERETLAKPALRDYEDKLRELEQLCEDVLELSFSALAHGRPPPPYGVSCPFPGLQAFTAEQRNFFRGRDAMVKTLLDQLTTKSFLAVLGASGSGKSSLVMAGVVPRLQDKNPELKYASFKPGNFPLDKLEDTLADLERAPDKVIYVDQFEEAFTLCRNHDTRTAFIDRLLEIAGPKCRVIISMRADFIGDCAFHKGLRERLEGLRLVPPMSADELRNAIEEQGTAAGLRYETGLCELILEDLKAEPGAMPLLQHALRELYERRRGRWLRLQAYEAIGRVQQAITNTAEKVWERLEPNDQERLVSVMLDLTEVRETEGEVRYLRRRVPLDHLYASRTSTAPPWSTYSSSTEQKPIARLINLLADERLLVKSQDETFGDVVEVAHEALLRSWGRLQEWLAAARDSIRLRQDMEAAATRWRDNEQSPAYLEHVLERGDRVRLFLREGTLKLDPRLQEYFSACEEEEQRQKEEKERQQQEKLEAAEKLAKEQGRRADLARRFSVVVGGVGVLALFAAVAASVFASEADKQQGITRSTAWKSGVAEEQAKQKKEAAEEAQEQTQEAFKRQEGTNAEFMADEPGQWAEAVAKAVSLAVDNPTKVETLDLELRKAIYAATRGLHLARELKGHLAGVTDLEFSPDGTQLATASNDHTVKIWDVGSPSKPPQTLEGHKGPVHRVEFIRPRGKNLLTVSKDTTLALWDHGEPDGFPEPIEEELEDACVSANGQQLAIAGKNGALTLWTRRMDGGYDPKVVLEPQERPSVLLSCSPAGARTLAIYGSAATLVNAEGQQLQRLELIGHRATIEDAQWSSDGTRVVTGDGSGSVRVWDADTGAELQAFQGTGEVKALAFSPGQDGKHHVAAALERVVEIWDVDSGEKLATLRGHRSTVTDLAYFPNGRQVATVSWDKTLRLWNATTGAEDGVLEGHDDPIEDVEISPDGTWIATAARSGVVRLWQASSAAEKTLLYGGDDTITRMTSTRDGSRIAMKSTREATVWSMATKDRHAVDASPSHLVMSDDGTRLAVIEDSKTPLLFKLDPEHPGEPEIEDELPTREGAERIISLAISSDGQMVAAGEYGGNVAVWDLGAKRPPITLTADSHVTALAFSPDGKHLATGTTKIQVWTLDKQSSLATLDVGNLIVSMAFSPDGKQIATGDQNAAVTLWSWSSGEQVPPMTGHLASVNALAFSPNGTRLITGSVDASVRLWDTQKHEFLFSPGTHAREVIMTRFVTDDRVITGSKDGAVYEWVINPQQRLGFACEALQNVALAEYEDQVTAVCSAATKGAAKKPAKGEPAKGEPAKGEPAKGEPAPADATATAQ